MNPRQELESIIEFKGGSGLNKGERIDKFFQNHGGKLAIAAGIAAGAGLKIAVGNHRKKQKEWAANAGDRDFLDLTHNLVVDKHGAMLPKSHPSVVGGNIHKLSARQQLDRIINFDMSTAIADKLGKVAWDKIGGSALKWGGTGAIAGAATGGITGAMDGDPIGGAMRGAVGGAVLGAGGAAMHEAGAFNHIIGTVEERAAKAAARKLAQTTEAAAPAAKQAAAAAAAAPKPSAYKGMPDDVLTPRKPIQKREPVLGGYNVPSKTVNAPVGVNPPQGKIIPMPQAQGNFPIDDPKRRIAASARDALDSIIQMSMEEPTERTKRASKENWAAKIDPKVVRGGISDKESRRLAREAIKKIAKIGKTTLSASDQLNTIMFGIGGLLGGVEKSAAEKIVSAANRYSNGKIVTGYSHAAAHNDAIWKHGIIPSEHTLEGGFMTNTNRFVDREEAARIAKGPHRSLESGVFRTMGNNLSARDQLNLITLGVDANGKLHNSKGEFGGDNDAVAHPTAMRMTYGKALGIAATTGTAGGIAGVSAKALLEKLKSIKRK